METPVQPEENILNKQNLMPDLLVPSSWKRRLANNLLDTLFFYIFSAIVGVVIGLLAAATSSSVDTEFNTGLEYLFSFSILFLYFSVFEAAFGRTLGKMITNTKVVMPDGSKPPLKNILGRSLARLIPFDAFSYLSKRPVGWHDSLSGTMVVDNVKLYENSKDN